MHTKFLLIQALLIQQKSSISGPNGFRMETNDTNVSFSSALKDGNYTFEVSEQTLAKESQSKLANGRDSEQLPSRYGEAVADSEVTF